MRSVSIGLCCLILSGLGRKNKYLAPKWSSPTPETYTRPEDRMSSSRPWGMGPSEEELQYITMLKDLDEMSKIPCAEIEGVRELPGVSAYAAAREVAYAVGAGSFKYAFRHNESTAAIKPIIIVFDSYKAQEQWLRASRKKKTPLFAHRINGRLPPGRVYICELLSPFNKMLLVRAKNFSKVRNFKAVWSHRGGVFLRRTDRTRVYRILNTYQLRNVVNGVY